MLIEIIGSVYTGKIIFWVENRMMTYSLATTVCVQTVIALNHCTYVATLQKLYNFGFAIDEL